MQSMHTIKLHQVLDPVLAGRIAGKAARPRLDQAARGIPEGTTTLLDLSGLEILTASFFLASVREVFWESDLSRERDLYPICYQAPPEVADEIEIALKAKSVPGLLASGPVDALSVEPVNMEGQARETYEIVCALGQATAADLLREDEEKGKARIGKTGWSNRLAALHRQRILRRLKSGRELIYAPCWR